VGRVAPGRVCVGTLLHTHAARQRARSRCEQRTWVAAAAGPAAPPPRSRRRRCRPCPRCRRARPAAAAAAAAAGVRAATAAPGWRTRAGLVRATGRSGTARCRSPARRAHCSHSLAGKRARACPAWRACVNGRRRRVRCRGECVCGAGGISGSCLRNCVLLGVQPNTFMAHQPCHGAHTPQRDHIRDSAAPSHTHNTRRVACATRTRTQCHALQPQHQTPRRYAQHARLCTS
jgi:hypothetical protein